MRRSGIEIGMWMVFCGIIGMSRSLLLGIRIVCFVYLKRSLGMRV